jgi:hypothetical protein
MDGANVGDPGPRGVRREAGEHAGGRIDVDDLAATQRERQAVPAGATAHVYDHVVERHIGRDDLQVRLQRSPGVRLE